MYGYNIFHNETVEKLLHVIRTKKNPHAWIISGEEGMGKHETANLLSCAIVCQNRESAPCGACHSCIMAKAGTHPDIYHVIPEEKKKTIGVDTIRRLNDEVFIKPFSSEKKVYIIEGDLLTPDAQNAFLKTLEEPPLYTVFLITVSDEEKLLQTVRSRCASVRLPPLKSSELSEYLSKKYPQLSESIDFYVQFSGGNPTLASKLIEDGEFDILRNQCFTAVTEIFSSKTEDAFRISNFFDKNKDKLEDITEIILMFFRDILFIGCGYSEKVINSDYIEQMRSLTMYTDIIPHAIDILALCSEMAQRNVSPKHIGSYLALSIKKREVISF